MQADQTYDVVVIGSGAGGFSAALTAAIKGLSVAVFEKTDKVGGSTAVSGGAVWVPFNDAMPGMGIEDSRENTLRYLEAVLGNRMNRDLMGAYLDRGPEMLRFMAANTEVTFDVRAFSPDYASETPGASMGGRTMDPKPFDGRRLGRDFARLRDPLHSFVILGGMMVNRKDINDFLGMTKSLPKFVNATKLVLRHLSDRVAHKRGTRLLLGNALAARLFKSALDRNIPVVTGAEAEELIVEQGRVVGVRMKIAGRTQVVAARRGVVLATGGFPASPRLRAQFVPHAEVHRSMAPEGNTGAGMELATRIGAKVVDTNRGAGLWTPVSVLKRADGSEKLYPHLIMDRQKPGLIAVDAKGNRFTNESASYHEFTEAMQNHPGAVPTWLVVDADFLARYGLGLVRPKYDRVEPFVKAGYLLRAPTLTDLAAQMGVDAGNLQAAADGMNEAARTGVDPAFGKGSTRYNRYLGDPEHQPNPCLGPIARAPFYAVKVWPGDIGSATGLATDPDARVLDADGQPIAGLYAAGNDMNSVMAGHYPAAGITLGPALTFGYIAGSALAAANN